MDDQPTVRDLLSRGRTAIISLLGPIYEHSPWVSQELCQDESLLNKITTVTELGAAMKKIVNNATKDRKLNLLNAHPDLCQLVGKMDTLSKESQIEQDAAGLQSLTDEELLRFNKFNTAYRKKFGFPFILAVRNATKYTVLAALEGRLGNSVEREFPIALEQVHKIAWMRLLANLNTEDCQGYLTCHVLDTANGCPASGMRVTLHRLTPPEGKVGDFRTNEDGRLERGPALKGSAFQVGVYEWTFYVADYFAAKGTYTSGLPFLDEVPLRFGIDNPDEHYHVPLLVSPWSFSTYRGS